MRLYWRRWLRGPKHGLARGVAVGGGPGFRHDRAQVTDLLSECGRLRAWAGRQQIELDGEPPSLATLDEAFQARPDEAAAVPSVDCGLYLGTVMVQNLPDAHWHVWPNGHPVVRLSSGLTMDVVAQVRRRTPATDWHLADLYAEAARRAAG